MTRSTDECEMSRSCHRATFSSPACALARTTRASPLICSQVTGIALVRHGRRALLLLAEKLLGLAHFGALQVANFGGDLVQRAGDHGQRRQIVRRGGRAGSPARRPPPPSIPGARRSSLQVPASRCAKVPTAPENLPTRMSSAAALKALDVALRLRVPVGQLEAEGDGLGVDAVGASDHGRVLELPGAALQHFGEALQILRE